MTAQGGHDAPDVHEIDADLMPAHSTVTDFARFRGWSTSVPRATATT
jgi:hypothetical protein